MVYHIFNYLISGTWYRDSAIYSEEQFSRIMDAIGWRLPANIRVYHFGVPDQRHYALTNRIVLERPVLSLDPMLLFNSAPSLRVQLHDKILQRNCPVIRQVGRFVLAEERGEWPRFLYVDGVGTSLIQELVVVPLTLRTASTYVKHFHRHNTAPQGHKFSIGLTVPGVDGYVGVAIASTPKARALADGRTLEINRVCCDPAYFNACSKLYAAVIRAGRAMGYSRFITYTLSEESGASVKAVGFCPAGTTRAAPRGWDAKSRPRPIPERYPTGRKQRWVLTFPFCSAEMEEKKGKS